MLGSEEYTKLQSLNPPRPMAQGLAVQSLFYPFGGRCSTRWIGCSLFFEEFVVGLSVCDDSVFAVLNVYSWFRFKVGAYGFSGFQARAC